MRTSTLLTLVAASLVSASPLATKHDDHATVYLIRHGEKPASGDGLDPQGVQRSKCLVDVFGRKSQYNIDYIMAEDPKKGEFATPRPHLSRI